VFDLQNVKHMDSSCVGAMVEMLTRLQRSGGAIALVNAAQSVEYLFRLTRLDRLFPICRDVMTAIQAVERASKGGKQG
jgi:anti-sigma B factor antagonist